MEPNPYESPLFYYATHAAESRVRTVGLLVAGLLFLLSLGGGTISTERGDGVLLGFVCLLIGMGHLAWYANPFIFLATLFLLVKRPQWAAGFAAVATVLALTTLLIKEILVNAAGSTAPVTGYGMGFYLWVGCCVALLATSLLCLAIRLRQIINATHRPPG